MTIWERIGVSLFPLYGVSLLYLLVWLFGLPGGGWPSTILLWATGFMCIYIFVMSYIVEKS